MKWKSTFLIVAACAFVGCAAKYKTVKVDPAKVNWSEEVGLYTYGKALAELGKPIIVSESESGTTAEWVLRRGPRMSFGLGIGGGTAHTGAGVGTQIPLPNHGENLRLSFDKTGLLTGWTKVKY